jgi:hypothetical protein
MVVSVVVLGAACAAASCSSSSSSTTSVPPREDVPRPVVSLSDGDRQKPASCADDWLAGSTGRVTNERGDAIIGAKVGYCTYGRESAVCLPFVATEKGGWYSLVVDASHRCITKLSVRVMPPEGERLSEAFCAPKVTLKAGVLDLEPDLRVYSLRAPTALPPMGDPAKARTIAFEDGLELTFAPDDVIESDQYARLSAGPLPEGERPCFLGADVTMDALYAFGPAMNVSVFAERPKIRFALPNPKKLAEGTAVEVFVLGGSGTQLDMDHAIDEGSFVRIGTGRVVKDRVVPDPGSELPALTVVGYRRK